jgi:hypothetical protein
VRLDPDRGLAPAHGLDQGAESHQRFWQATVQWLVRHRDELTEEACQAVLEWAMHRHTEDVARGAADRDRFSWRGRALAPTLEQASEYRELIRGRWWGRRVPITWKRRGWDWEHRHGERSWAVRELTSDDELRAESAAMHHCVASYAYRCAQGRSVIFSVTLDGARRITVELDPSTRGVIQARGLRNRECSPEERDLLRRWLDALDAADSRPT